jgi:hypothetical protein
MADEPLITLMGAEEVTADIAKWMDRLPDDIRGELQSFAAQLAGILSGKQPVLTGALAGSVELLPPEVDSFFGLALGREIVYAGWIEFGGSRGRPYVPDGRTVWPTVLEAESQYDRLVEAATQHSIDKFPWHQEPGS